MKNRIVIPARLKSSRLPYKLIKLIGKLSLIEHICLRAKKITCDSITVATDSLEIKSLVEKHGIDVWFSRKKYSNGTHRIAMLCKDLKFNKNDNIINIQGDEFNFPLKGIKDIISKLTSSKNKSAYTLVTRSKSSKSYNNSDTVKVIFDKNNNALYFSRSSIPFNPSNDHYQHIGIYGYKVSLLDDYISLKRSPHEIYESLEQLRFIWNKIPIHCIKAQTKNSISINSSNDLRLAKEFIK